MAALLIVNPRASGVTERRLAAVRHVLPAGTAIAMTQARGDATAIAREAESTVSAIYVFAGDGTANEVLNGVSGRVPLGFIPGGGTSVLARAIGSPRDAVAAARRLGAGRVRRIGLGRVNGRRFGFNAGLGLDAELVRRVDALGRRGDGRRPGDVAFVRTTLGLLLERGGRFPPALDVEGVGRAAFCLVANCDPYTYIGPLGLHLAPGARFEGGLDLVAPVELSASMLPRFAWSAFTGRTGAKRFQRLHDADRVAVQCDYPTALHVDGEDLGDVDEAVFEAERDAVSVIV